jgi:hypothetical protein
MPKERDTNRKTGVPNLCFFEMRFLLKKKRRMCNFWLMSELTELREHLTGDLTILTNGG